MPGTLLGPQNTAVKTNQTSVPWSFLFLDVQDERPGGDGSAAR